MINTFFDAAIEAIKKEEKELNDLFSGNKGFYKNHHHGVCNLYETTFVYLIFKELLRRKFPHMVYWEYPYPGNTGLHSDIAILDKDQNLEALIEFKIWMEDDDRRIRADVDKLQKVKDAKKFVFVIGYGGDIEENDRYLKRNPQLQLFNKKGLMTTFYKTKLGRIEDNELNVFLYEVI